MPLQFNRLGITPIVVFNLSYLSGFSLPARRYFYQIV